MKQSIWTETANSRGIPPPSTETSVRLQHLTETKCEQICTRKREITFAHFNPHVSSVLPNKSLRLCTVARERTDVYGGGGEVEEEKKRNQRKYLARRFTTLAKRFHCRSSRSSSSVCFKPEVWQRRKGGRAVGRGGRLKMALRLLLSGLNKSIKTPLKGG